MKGRKIVSLLLALTLIMTTLPVPVFAMGKVGVGAPILQGLETQETTPAAIELTPSKYVGDGYEVEFKVTRQESDTFSGEIILTNVGESDIVEWELQFDFQHDIINLQNAILVNQQNDHYIIKGADKSSTILQKEQIVLYFDATYDAEIVQPKHYILEKRILDEKIDLENYPQDEEAYRIWKEKVIEELKREQMNNEANKRSLFASGSTSGSVENEYVKFNYSNGTYGLFTTGGNPDNPNDDNKKLLYGTGSTSYTTIRIDGIDHRFSPDMVTEFDNKIIGSKQYGDLIVSQHISIIPNQYTNRDDVVEFFYTVENTSDTPHGVGIRIMFDTMLGGNDHAPFRLPALGDVTTETDLFGDEIPEFWQAFDSLTSPNVIAQGTLKLDKSSTPDRVRFTNWGSATSNPWDYVRTAGSRNGDSAVCLYWNEKSVGKDDVFSCKTFYGLSALQQDLRPPLAVALSGTTKLEVVEGSDGKEKYSPNPFTVTAYIQNIGTGAAENANITLNLPKGMEVLDGPRTVNLGAIPVGTKQHQVSWKVKVAPGSVDKIEKYGVTVTANNTDPKTLEREITIPKLQTSKLKLLLDRNSIKDGNTLNLKFKLINEGVEAIDLSQLYTRYYYMDESPSVGKQVHVDSVQFNSPYGALKKDVTTKSVQTITPLRKDANAYIEFGFNAGTKKLLPGQEAVVGARVNNITWSKMIMTNDYSYLGGTSDTSKGYIPWEHMPVYNKSDPDSPIWGVEPPMDNIGLEPALLVEFKPNAVSGKKFMTLNIKLTNTGLVPIDLGDLDVKYYYTNDDGHPQSVAGHYVGGRINNKWPNITSKTKARVVEMEDVKQLADHYVDVTFDKDAGTLLYEDYVELNLQVYNTNWIPGEYILENDHSYQTSTMSTFALTPTVSGTSGMTKASNIVVASSIWPWSWGKEPEKYRPTFTAFKIGQGDAETNKIHDYRTFTRLFISKFSGDIKSNNSVGNNIDHKFDFTEENLRNIIESDIAYISGHGFKGGTIPLYNSVENNLSDYNKVLVTDKNINTYQYPPNDTISQSNKFSINMKDNKNKGWNEKLNWMILGTCSQLNSTEEVGDYTSVDKWLDVLKSNKKLKGILGYYGSAPTAKNDWKKDYEVIDDFLTFAQVVSISEAWKMANFAGIQADFPIEKILKWGILVKGDCDNSLLYNSLADNKDVKYKKIYLYGAKKLTKSYKNTKNIDTRGLNVRDDIIYQVASHLTNSNLNIIINDDIVVSEVTKTTYDMDGNNEGTEVVEHLVVVRGTKNNNQGPSMLSKSAVSDNNKLVLLFKVDKSGVVLLD